MSLHHKIAVIANRVNEKRSLDVDDVSDLRDAAKRLNDQNATIAYLRRLTRVLREEVSKGPKEE